METTFKKTALERLTPLSRASTTESGELHYWRQMKVRFAEQMAGACTHCAIAPSETRGSDGSPTLRLACASSLNVHVRALVQKRKRKASAGVRGCKGITVAASATLGKFSTVCYGCSWRSDGRLIAAGDGFGYVHVIDATSGAVLRKLGDAKKQGAAIRTTTWAEEGSKLVSGGDDGGISIWDVTLGERIVSNSSAHKAEVRSVLSCGRSAWLTAGLDGVVKVWDERTSRESFVLDHGAPVESAATKGSELAVSAGGHDVVLWDLAMRRRGYAFSEAHAKACACVVFTSAGRRIISAGADGIVKAHSLADWSTSRVARFDEPVLCVACSHEDLLLAAGTAAGRLELRCRSEPSKPLKSRHRTLTPPPGTYRHFQRGKAFEPKPGDHIIYVAPPSQKKPKLHPYDEALRKFRYGDALDAALATRDPNIVVAVLAELNRRGGLRTAVDNRDEDRLETLLFFLASYIANPRYALRLTKVVHVALDIYRPILGVNPAIDELFQKIALKVKLEADNQRTLLRLSGAVRAVAAAASGADA